MKDREMSEICDFMTQKTAVGTGFIRRDSDLDRHAASFIVDAETFGSPDQFSFFVTALDAAIPWPPRRPRVAVYTVGWASDADESLWVSLNWGVIAAMPRPACLFDLPAVRRMARNGPLQIFPHINFDPAR